VSNLCNNGDVGVASFRLVQRIRHLLKLEWKVNSSTDVLTTLGCSSGSGLTDYDQPLAHFFVFANSIGDVYLHALFVDDQFFGF